jgi:hypothetical protein
MCKEMTRKQLAQFQLQGAPSSLIGEQVAARAVPFMGRLKQIFKIVYLSAWVGSVRLFLTSVWHQSRVLFLLACSFSCQSITRWPFAL